MFTFSTATVLSVQKPVTTGILCARHSVRSFLEVISLDPPHNLRMQALLIILSMLEMMNLRHRQGNNLPVVEQLISGRITVWTQEFCLHYPCSESLVLPLRKTKYVHTLSCNPPTSILTLLVFIVININMKNMNVSATHEEIMETMPKFSMVWWMTPVYWLLAINWY